MDIDKDALDRYITENYGEDQFDATPIKIMALPIAKDNEEELFRFFNNNEYNMEIELSLDDLKTLISGDNLTATDGTQGVLITLNTEIKK
jgi:hypothetical protein